MELEKKIKNKKVAVGERIYLKTNFFISYGFNRVLKPKRNRCRTQAAWPEHNAGNLSRVLLNAESEPACVMDNLRIIWHPINFTIMFTGKMLSIIVFKKSYSKQHKFCFNAIHTIKNHSHFFLVVVIILTFAFTWDIRK